MSSAVVQRLVSSTNVRSVARLLSALPRPSITPSHKISFAPPKHGGSYLSDPENKGERQAGINFDTLGSWNSRLDLEVNVEQSMKSGRLVPTISTYDIGHSTAQGRRKDNQDRTKVVQLTDDILMVGIFDGHGASSLASEYTSNAIEGHIMHWLEQDPQPKLTNVLHHAFIDVNTAFTKYLHHNYHGTDHADKNTGTTATVALLRYGVELVVAQVGDSRAVLCRDGNALQLSTDHNLEKKSEVRRIEAAGGKVIGDSFGIPRVNGKLEMTRSIGDVDLKHYGVTPEPTTRSIEVKHGRDAFLLLVTDGITFVLNNKEIVDIACTCESPVAAANFICDQALHYGTEDNCTALVVPYGAWGKYADNKKVAFSFGRNTIGKRYM